MWDKYRVYENKYAFTFEDLFTPTSIIGSKPFNFQWTRQVFISLGMDTCIASVIYSNYDYNYNPLTNYLFKPHIQELFQRLYARYWKEYVFIIDTDSISGSSYNDAKEEFYITLGNIIKHTYDRYAKLLDIYTSELSKLLDGVKTETTGVGRFNDTPQNITDGDEFGDNTHVSNITKSTAEAVSDADTKINRIDEIQRKFRNIWKDWLDEFESVFIERGNIQ